MRLQSQGEDESVRAHPTSSVSTSPARPAGRATLDRALLLLLLPSAVVVVLLPAVILQDRVFVLKLVVAGLLSILPGWLYLLFMKHKGHALYDEFVINLFRIRIDRYENLPMPPQHTTYFKPWKQAHERLGTSSKDNLYRKKFEALYGPASVSTYSVIHGQDRPGLRDRTETFSPVLMATVLISLGWVLVLEPELYRHLTLGMQLSGRPVVPIEALRFGFLGAYAFTLQDLIRRYFRDDLKAGAYISAAARLVFVAVIVTATAPIWAQRLSDGQQAALAFVIGFFPLVGLQAIQAAVAKPLRSLIPSVTTNCPLSRLDGLNVWYEARLSEEGIDDMQHLVTANLVDLMLSTRAPIHRLIDWVDQACLHLHLPAAPGDQMAMKGKAADDSLPAVKLRRLGIRTATDLERAYDRLGENDTFIDQFNEAVMVDKDAGRAVIEAILAGLAGEVNLSHVRRFREGRWLPHDDQPPLGSVSGPVSQQAAVSVPGLAEKDV